MTSITSVHFLVVLGVKGRLVASLITWFGYSHRDILGKAGKKKIPVSFEVGSSNRAKDIFKKYFQSTVLNSDRHNPAVFVTAVL